MAVVGSHPVGTKGSRQWRLRDAILPPLNQYSKLDRHAGFDWAKPTSIPPDGRRSSFVEHHGQLLRHGPIVDVASLISSSIELLA